MVVRLLCLLLLSTSALAEWRSTEDSTLNFEAVFEGAPLPGEFPSFSVVYIDGERLAVDIDLAKADLGDDEMNAVLFDAAWFGTEFAAARFEATRFSAGADGELVASGQLELKGITRNVDVPITWSENGDTATMSGEFTLDRTQFDVGSGEWSTGESIAIEVVVRFAVTLSR
ncbi:MAG: YceI family protein [Pseudomonadota bacterium]